MARLSCAWIECLVDRLKGPAFGALSTQRGHRSTTLDEGEGVLDRSLKLVSLSLVCLGLAFLLPSVRVQVLGSSTDLSGWQATWWAAALGGQSVSGIFVQPAIATLGQLALGLAAASNVTLIVTAIALSRRSRSTNLVRRLVAVITLGLFLAVAAPWMMVNPPTHVLAGYYVWLAAHTMALSALACSWQRDKPRAAGGAVAG